MLFFPPGGGTVSSQPPTFSHLPPGRVSLVAEAPPRDLGTLQGPLGAQGSGASGSQSPLGWLRAICVLVEFQMCKPSGSSQGRQNKNKPGLHLRGSRVPQDSRVAEDCSKRVSHKIARSSNPGVFKLGSANDPRGTDPIQGFP